MDVDPKALSTVIIAARCYMDDLRVRIEQLENQAKDLAGRDGDDATQKLVSRHVAVTNRQLADAIARRDELAAALAAIADRRA